MLKYFYDKIAGVREDDQTHLFQKTDSPRRTLQRSKSYKSMRASRNDNLTDTGATIETDDTDDTDDTEISNSPTFQRSSFFDKFKKLGKPQKRKKEKAASHQQHKEKNLTDTDELDDKDDEDISQFQCFECVQAIPVSSPKEIKVGDHVVFRRVIFDHHGIIISKANDEFGIIEATNTACRALLGMFKLCGGNAKIQSSKRKFDFDKERICVVKYNKRHSKRKTIKRAEKFESRSEKFKYNLIHNTCEHFATYCVTKKKIKVQVSKLRLVWELFWSSGFVGLSNEKIRNEKAKKKGLICEDCYELNKNILDVEKIPIRSNDDVHTGDIIQYTYWNLWHEAVVLAVGNPEIGQTNLTCTIAHYACCGAFSDRSIVEDEKVIQLDGKCFKLNYNAPKYDIYYPDEVVMRARERIGEKCFFLFSNDSSHFARWCKLTLFKS